MNITVNESVQRIPCQQRVPLHCLREIPWKLPQFWCEATARGINGSNSAFKSYCIYQQKKPAEFWQSLDTESEAVLPMSSSIPLLGRHFFPLHVEIKVEVRLPPSLLVFLFVEGTINNEGRSLGIRFVIQLVTFVVTESKKCKTLWMFLCKWINSSCRFMDMLA